jgi:hypothetical protein
VENIRVGSLPAKSLPVKKSFHNRDFVKKIRKSAFLLQNFLQDFLQICAKFLPFCDKF